jgi:type I restriction enzyme R subunit
MATDNALLNPASTPPSVEASWKASVMTPVQTEAAARVLIDNALTDSGWDTTNPAQVRFEQQAIGGRADYLLFDELGRALCVLEAKRADVDPYTAKEQARGYADNLNAPFVILSNGTEHWFWNLQRADEQDAFRIERMPSPEDLERLRLRNLNPPRPLMTEVIRSDYLRHLRPDLVLRRYQIDVLDTVARGFDDHNQRKFLLEMATGTGKTLLCAALIRRFLKTKHAERVLFIVDRIELANQTMEDFRAVLPEYSPVVFKSARKSGELLGSSVVVATIQSLMTDRRYREEFTPFYFDLVINDEAHRGIYGDAREAVQFFQATRVGLTATPKAYLKNVDVATLADQDPKTLEARQLRDTYTYFGCEPGQPTFRYDIIDAVKDPEGPFLCLPKIFDCRSEITTQALQSAGWSVTVNEQEENYKVSDLERRIFTPERNRVMCETFLKEAQPDPTGQIGKSLVFAVNQNHATALEKIFNSLQPGIAITITSRIKDASAIAKDFRDGKRKERIAVSVDMLSTGYNCRDLLNVVLMRPIFSPTEYIQIKGRGTRRFTFTVGNTEYEKKHFSLFDFCAVAEYFEEEYDYSVPLAVPRQRRIGEGKSPAYVADGAGDTGAEPAPEDKPERQIPIWEGRDTMLTQEIRIVGPDGEKVDVMTFRGSFEKDIKAFAERNPDFRQAVEDEDDDAVETIVQERFYHRPEHFYSPDKLVVSYGVPASTPAFVYEALGKRDLPSKETVIADTVDSIAARYNLRYDEQKWLRATALLIADDPRSFREFDEGKYAALCNRSQFQRIGGVGALTRFTNRNAVWESLRQSPFVQATRQAFRIGQ